MPDFARPGTTPVVMTLMAAAVIGFLVGALVATTSDPQSAPVSASPTRSPGSTDTGTPAPTSTVDAELSLTADRDSADTGELIRLRGVLVPAQGDVTLQVQQSVDDIGFVDFPVTADTRSDGSFAIWVKTGRVGRNEFRMVTDLDGAQVVSNSVVVRID